jgi:hypothetical protein
VAGFGVFLLKLPSGLEVLSAASESSFRPEIIAEIDDLVGDLFPDARHVRDLGLNSNVL